VDGCTMIDYDKLKIELEKLKEFLHGAQVAIDNQNCVEVLDIVCNKLDDLIAELRCCL
jgi:hypothetical protein